MSGVREREVKNSYRVFDLSSWKYGVVNQLEENKRRKRLVEKTRCLVLDISGLRCLLNM